MGDLIRTIREVPKDKQLIVFDLDGTLAESKTEIKSETAVLVSRLLKVKKVGIIGGSGLYCLSRIFVISSTSVSSPLSARSK